MKTVGVAARRLLLPIKNHPNGGWWSFFTNHLFLPRQQQQQRLWHQSYDWQQQQQQQRRHERCFSSSTSSRSTITTPEQSQSQSQLQQRQGLYSIPELMEPSDFPKAARQAMETCERLCSILERQEPPKTRLQASNVLYQLDEISRIVCNVIDAAEACRSTHANAAWRKAAQDAYITLSDFIAQLNTNVGLYRALVATISSTTLFSQLSDEEFRFAKLLQAEFEREGIHLDDEKRQVVRQLQNSIVELEGTFQYNLVHWNRSFRLQRSDVEDVIPRHVLYQMFGFDGGGGGSSSEEGNATSMDNDDNNEMVDLDSQSLLLQTLLKNSSSPDLRKQVYMEYHTSVPENLRVLQQLRRQRHILATTVGFDCFATYVLANNKMAGNTQQVRHFLDNLAAQNKPRFQQEMALLFRAKQHVQGFSSSSSSSTTTTYRLEPWDMAFYSSLIKNELASFDPHEISKYLTLEQCVHAITVLCRELFGIQMIQVPIHPEDAWDMSSDTVRSNDKDRVRCFKFQEIATGRPLGTMYLDLHPRPGKYSHAAHFTVRCGCLINNHDNNQQDDDSGGGGDNIQYQLPIIALVCNLSSSSSGNLSHGDVETLLHEMGHALHSLLSRTRFQHVSGTRAAMDFVEMPSHLLENYAWDPSFLKHVLTTTSGDGGSNSIPDELINKLVQSRHLLQGIEKQTQILYAMFDQQLFGVPPPPPHSSEVFFSERASTDIFAKLHETLGVPYQPGTHWHSRFGHLVTYGGGYYSYLFAQEFAREIWAKKFQGQSLNLPAGQELWHKVLVHGGAKDPHLMLQDLLGTPN